MNKIITNAGIVWESEFKWDQFKDELSVYEVIRIVDGIPLFLEDHYKRFIHSMEIQGVLFDFGYNEFKRNITDLVKLSVNREGNVKFVYSLKQNDIQWYFAYIPHSYPALADYENGVSTDFLFAERKNPSAKINQNSIREKVNQLIGSRKLYEVLLVDHSGLITEGSRSNVFFVKGNVFFTAPVSQVLGGITRLKVIECLNDLGFKLVEVAVRASEIDQYDGVFLTGTSPKVLSVRSIGNQNFNTQLVWVKQLMECYDKRISEYLQDRVSDY